MRFRVEEIYYNPLVKLIPDKAFLRLHYLISCKKMLNLRHPTGFNEKLQWLKLNDRKPVYTQMVDKIEAKKLVAGKLGDDFIIPTLGVWDRVDEIDFDSLPDRFVIKCSHDSGGLVICRDKSRFDRESAKRKINESLNRNYYWLGREWPYRNVKPRILAEQFMSEVDLSKGFEGSSTVELGLTDYKFYCFNGEPRFLYVSKGLEDHSTALMSFVSMDWELTEFQRSDFASFGSLPEKPATFEQMKSIAGVLSEGIPFVRVDLYEIAGRVYFSEMSFTPSSGFALFSPGKWEDIIGDWIDIDDYDHS